jgi:hypothetical protein
MEVATMNVTRNFLILACVVVALGTTSNVRADFLFGEPVKFGYTLAGGDDVDCFSSDGLEMYIDSPRAGGQGDFDLWVLKRASVDDDWGPPVNLGPAVNTPQVDWLSSISTDGLALYFCSDRPGGHGGSDIYMSTRASKNAPWEPPVNLGPQVNSSSTDYVPWISSNSLELYLASDRPGGYGSFDLYVARRATTNDPWGDAVNLGPIVSSPYGEADPSLSPDGLLLFFSDYYLTAPPRPGGYGGPDTWMARRASLSDPWQTPVNLGPRVNGPGPQTLPRISLDGRTLYFWGNHPGEGVWQAPIIPIVDFNGDGKVDIQDLVRLIESWGKGNPSVDMGPFPWGDGVVDEKDLEVLMSYWGQEAYDPNLMAHWKLDEASGLIAADTAGANYGTLVGNPTWQPAGGRVGGALQLDGIDDHVRAAFVVDPAKGPFSVFAWIKGGAPGQVIVSQVDGANWLMLDSATGALMTELGVGGRLAKALRSHIPVTDGNWHRVGFTWDNSNRTLYVDDAEVARDAQVSLAGSAGYMIIGTGSTFAPGTFWSGLIDEVRIYSQAVKP